ncbi:MAG: NAD-dependent epimerase/dehydratase family protein, partial [Pusillimonas sp.]
MKVLIAGATGVLGPPTVRLLLAKGHEVIALFRSERSERLLKSLGAQPVKADVLDAAGLIRLAQSTARGVEAVLNLATVIPRDATVP